MSAGGAADFFGWTGAEFSPCERYRYRLWRIWQPADARVMFLMLNPSTATATTDDPTIRRCIGYARAWGYGSLTVGNLYGYRTPDPAHLFRQDEPVGAGNDAALRAMMAEAALVVAAWGHHGEQHPARVEAVLALTDRPLHCLRQLSSGQPAHPLYQPQALRPPLPVLPVSPAGRLQGRNRLRARCPACRRDADTALYDDAFGNTARVFLLHGTCRGGLQAATEEGVSG